MTGIACWGCWARNKREVGVISAGGRRRRVIHFSKSDVAGSAKRQARSKADWGDRRGAYITDLGHFKGKMGGFLGGG